jgi:hypothetical protein
MTSIDSTQLLVSCRTSLPKSQSSDPNTKPKPNQNHQRSFPQDSITVEHATTYTETKTNHYQSTTSGFSTHQVHRKDDIENKKRQKCTQPNPPPKRKSKQTQTPAQLHRPTTSPPSRRPPTATPAAASSHPNAPTRPKRPNPQTIAVPKRPPNSAPSAANATNPLSRQRAPKSTLRKPSWHCWKIDRHRHLISPFQLSQGTKPRQNQPNRHPSPPHEKKASPASCSPSPSSKKQSSGPEATPSEPTAAAATARSAACAKTRGGGASTWKGIPRTRMEEQ